jgi:hypothetical protein
MGSQIERNNAILFFFFFPTHTSYYSYGEVEAILAKAQAKAKQIVIVSEYIKKVGPVGELSEAALVFKIFLKNIF